VTVSFTPLEGALSADRARAGSLLVIDAVPVKWSLPAAQVLSITTVANWPHRVSSLDLLFGGAQPDQDARVLVLRSSLGDCAFSTHHVLRLQTFEPTSFLPLPTLVFKDSKNHPMRYVVFQNDSGPVIVLDIDRLYQLANITAVGSHPTRPPENHS
jgi:hypothetical protein